MYKSHGGKDVLQLYNYVAAMCRRVTSVGQKKKKSEEIIAGDNLGNIGKD